MALLQDPYPEVELIPPPLAQPLCEPRPLSPSRCSADECQPSTNRKRESYNMAGSTFLITASGITLRLPVPSNSKADPLNWGRWRRIGAIFAVGWYSAMASMVIQAASVVLPNIMEDFNEEKISSWTIGMLVTAPTLFMGIGSLLWLPLSIGLGRRPVFLVVALMMPLAAVGAGRSANFTQLLACICILGLGQGFSVTSAFLMVIDMTFIHQRVKAIASLWCLLGSAGTGLLAVVPSMCLSSEGIVWRQFYYYWSIPMAISFVLAFLLYPETYFKRPTVAFDGLIVLQSATEKLTVYKDDTVDSEIYRELPDLPSEFSLSLSRSPFASWSSMCHCIFQMAFCSINPLIFWVIFVSAIHWTGVLFIGSTYTAILRSPPYNLPATSSLILINISSAIGALMAYPVGGLLIDKILRRLAQRNSGVREAEHYLVGYIPPAIIGAASTLIYGLAVQYKLNVGFYYLSCGLESFSWIALSISNTLWVTEAFPRWAGPAIAVSGGASYILSFSLGFALSPWLNAHGFGLVGIELAILHILAGLVALPVAFWGKSARQAIHGRWSEERAGALRPL